MTNFPPSAPVPLHWSFRAFWESLRARLPAAEKKQGLQAVYRDKRCDQFLYHRYSVISMTDAFGIAGGVKNFVELLVALPRLMVSEGEMQ